MDASQSQAAELVSNVLQMMSEDEEEMDVEWATLVREEELHALVEAHDSLTSVVAAIEDEFQYRVDHDDGKLVAGDESDREYAAVHGNERY